MRALRSIHGSVIDGALRAARYGALPAQTCYLPQPGEREPICSHLPHLLTYLTCTFDEHSGYTISLTIDPATIVYSILPVIRACVHLPNVPAFR